MVNCVVTGCRNRTNRGRLDHRRGVRFFNIPTKIVRHCNLTRSRTERRRKMWLERINRPNLQDDDVRTYTRVCSAHFVTGAPAPLWDEDNLDWAPSLNLGYIYEDIIPTSTDTDSLNKQDPLLIVSDHKFKPESADNSVSSSNKYNSEDCKDNSVNTNQLLAKQHSNVKKTYSNLQTTVANLRKQIVDLEADKLQLRTALQTAEKEIESLRNQLKKQELLEQVTVKLEIHEEFENTNDTKDFLILENILEQSE